MAESQSADGRRSPSSDSSSSPSSTTTTSTSGDDKSSMGLRSPPRYTIDDDQWSSSATSTSYAPSSGTETPMDVLVRCATCRSARTLGRRRTVAGKRHTGERHATLPASRRPKRRKVVHPLPFKPSTWPDMLNLARMTSRLIQHHVYRDCEALAGILPAMEEVDAIIGLNDIKQVLADHIIATCLSKSVRTHDMCHIVITGPSGCGKTTLARAVAKLFNGLGLLKSDKVVVGRRANMVAPYIGQTSAMTQKLIDEAVGGCLLIDEAYQLGTQGSEGTDSFSKTCLNTLNQNLTERGDKFQCIVVGYKDSMEKEFFAHNPGLRRRFQWTFEVPACGAAQLRHIFLQMVGREGLRVAEGACPEPWFAEHLRHFPHHGGSMQNLLSKVKVAHCRRVIGETHSDKGRLTAADVHGGFTLYTLFDMSHKAGENSRPPDGMYA